jgi:hypothetical protein
MKLTALVTVLAALVFAGSAVADTTYTDPTGEDAASADIGSIVVSNDPGAHTITFKVQITNMPALEDNAEVDLLVDSDRNATTGASGFDYAFFVDKGGWGFSKWDATTSQFVDVPEVTSLPVNFNNGLLTVTFHEPDLAVTTGFDFAVLTYRGPDPAAPATDQAPNSAPIYTYALAAAPAAPATATVKGTSVSVSAKPVAGKKFTVSSFNVDLTDGTSIELPGKKCTATLGGAKLKGSGAGGCTFALPKTAKGKKLSVKVSAKTSTVTLSKTITYVVK